jgi:hypothetical protein
MKYHEHQQANDDGNAVTDMLRKDFEEGRILSDRHGKPIMDQVYTSAVCHCLLLIANQMAETNRLLAIIAEKN